VWGIALLHTLQDFFVFGFYCAMVVRRESAL